ncbi:uridine 5'-monophosphate synthase [Coccinella septempunctata]|uniref:uridine 5'-monophosphate synthase n=1 Tax=Coccinella septempunctata TaxID=41139 RepID=UPI001D081FD1|nr:uridine 5'-monophosphate synthase [Coccinella septempunctata]
MDKEESLKMEDLVVRLFEINAIKFGNYKTKIGLDTPIYFDLRVIVSCPRLLRTLALIMMNKIKISKFNLLCGVPYTALPIASIMSEKSEIPMVMRRKEAKAYGTKKLIEGIYTAGENCLIIEDCVTSGSSILETVKDLRECQINCSEAVVLLDREQGGEAFLKENGIVMHSLLTMSQLVQILFEKDLITAKTKSEVESYIALNKIKPETLAPKEDRLKMSFEKRIPYAINNGAKKLLEIMIEKETNLCVAADLTDATDILNLAEEVGPFICCLKTHIDIVKDFHPNFIKNLRSIAQSHNFMLMEDRKFADIGKTVQLQFTEGVFGINSWASLVTAHSLFGESLLDALDQVSSSDTGVFLLAEASSSGCLFDDQYKQKTIKLASKYENLIAGIVCQSPLFKEHPGFLQLTPGVQLNSSGDNLGQQYNSPENVIISKGGDIAVVGRGITTSANARKEAKKYKDLLWNAYLQRVK